MRRGWATLGRICSLTRAGQEERVCRRCIVMNGQEIGPMFSRDKPATTPATPAPSPPSTPSPPPETAARPAARAPAQSIISSDLTIKGNLTCSGDIQIDGHVEGDVASQSVKIGEGADMRGTITAETARICGTVQGEIKAATVALEKTAKVTGNILHKSLSIEAGAWFEGQCRRTDSPSTGEGKRAGGKS
jgi:cytoskeletal protein CcmA (bactofilin family)